MVACPCEVCASADKKDKRLRSSILVQSPSTTLVVDTTPDFRYQMLHNNIRQLDAVIFTHPHKDHLAGLDDVRAYNFFQHRPMDLFANEMTQEAIVREFPYAFADIKYPGIPDLRLNRIDKEPFRVGDITYITDANRIEEDEKEKIRGSQQIVLNALRHEKHVSHFNLEEAIEEVQELGIPRAWFTHISHQLGKHADVNPTLPPGMELGYDGLIINA